MKKIEDIVFINNLPSIDLHGYDTQTAEVIINDFIKENLKLKNEFIVIVHGIGSGILRRKTWEILKKNKKILDYKSYYFNRGCTIIQLNLEKK